MTIKVPIAAAGAAPAEGNFIGRFANYSFVNNLVEGAKSYYLGAKGSSELLKRSCETVESTLTDGYKWIAPRVEPVLKNESVAPILHTVDHLACQQLDRFEKITESVQNKRQKFSSDVAVLKRKSFSELAGAGKEKLEATAVAALTPVDGFLKTSIVFAAPLTVALDVTERITETVLPRDAEENAAVQLEEKVSVGPVFRAGRLSKRVQRRALKRLHNLSISSSAQAYQQRSLKYCADLIQYASVNFHEGVKASNVLVGNGIQKVSELSGHANLHDVKGKLQTATTEAVKAVSATLDVISRHVPQSVTTIPTRTYAVIRQRIANLNTQDQLTAFGHVCQHSFDKLHKVSGQVNEMIAKNEVLPQHLIKVAQKLVKIVDNLAVSADHFVGEHLGQKDQEKESKKE